MTGPTQVFVVTHGEYSDYGISSIWLTVEEAKVAAGDGRGRVEVWAIGENKRTLGCFFHSADINSATGEVLDERSYDGADLGGESVEVLHWPNARFKRLGIRVTAETQERADKVYSEVKARVLADISTGLPPEVIATREYGLSGWQAIKR